MFKKLILKYLRNLFNEEFKTSKEELRRTEASVIKLKNELNELKRYLSHNSKVGVNIDQRGGRSWAVVCIEGKYDTVNFIDLDRRDAHEISYFLRNFQRDKVSIDAPIGLENMLKYRCY
ncbi:hypothetical protein [Tenacibaculum phage Larrie]|nr:hypothetical protein [Tenacibaculum phage Larrie]